MTASPESTCRGRIVAAFLIGLALALAIVLAKSRGDVDRMVEGDGLIYRYVAAHFDQAPEDVDPVVVERGTSLRYGRAGLSFLIWLGSAGRPGVMPYAQPIILILAAGAASAAVVTLLPDRRLLFAALPFITPGFIVAVSGGYAEVLAVALALWAVVAWRQERWVLASIVLAGAILTRENAGAILIGLAIVSLVQRRPRRLGWLLLSLVPVLGWHVFIASRYGHLPLLDPYLRSTTDTIAPPGVAVWRALTQTTAGSALTAAVHLMLALVAFTMWRRSDLGAIASAAGLQVLSAGAFSWAFEGEAVRTMVFLELFFLLAVVARTRLGRTSLAAGS